MADDADTPTNQEPAAPAPQAPATPAPQTVTLTVEEFEAKLNERAAQVRRAEQAKAKPQPEAPKSRKNEDTQPQGLSAEELDAMLSRRSAFDRALGKAGLEGEQVSILEALFKIEKPDDPAEWVSRKSKAFGAQKPVTQNAQQPAATPASAAATPAPAPAPAQPATPHPAPTGSSQPQLPGEDMLSWSKSQQAAYVGQLGYDRRHWLSKDSRDAAHKVRQEFEKRLNRVIVRGPDEG